MTQQELIDRYTTLLEFADEGYEIGAEWARSGPSDGKLARGSKDTRLDIIETSTVNINPNVRER